MYVDLNKYQNFDIKLHLIDRWGRARCSNFPGDTCQFVVIAANAHVTGFVCWQKLGVIPMIEAKSVHQGGDVLEMTNAVRGNRKTHVPMEVNNLNLVCKLSNGMAAAAGVEKKKRVSNKI